jgi:hypothetical protein
MLGTMPARPFGRRTPLHNVMVLAALTCACGKKQDEPPPRQVDRKVDINRIPVPNHGPEVMAGTHETRRTKTTEGMIEAMLDDQHVEHGFLPYGMNAAVTSEETGVSRVTLVGSPTDAGYPALHIELEGLRLDQLELPKTFTAARGDAKKGKSKKQPSVRPKILYYETEQIVFSADPEREEDPFSVTIESYEGQTVRGTFEAVLHPRSAHFGKPKTVERGRFEVLLRLSGVEPKEPAQ